MIFVIDSDEVMAGCIARACEKVVGRGEVMVFPEALSAMAEISAGVVPEMILMDVILTGPDGFTFLNELISYEDTAKVPVVVISEVDFHGRDLSVYGVVATLNKDSFTPGEVISLAGRYAGRS